MWFESTLSDSRSTDRLLCWQNCIQPSFFKLYGLMHVVFISTGTHREAGKRNKTIWMWKQSEKTKQKWNKVEGTGGGGLWNIGVQMKIKIVV